MTNRSYSIPPDGSLHTLPSGSPSSSLGSQFCSLFIACLFSLFSLSLGNVPNLKGATPASKVSHEDVWSIPLPDSIPLQPHALFQYNLNIFSSNLENGFHINVSMATHLYKTIFFALYPTMKAKIEKGETITPFPISINLNETLGSDSDVSNFLTSLKITRIEYFSFPITPGAIIDYSNTGSIDHYKFLDSGSRIILRDLIGSGLTTMMVFAGNGPLGDPVVVLVYVVFGSSSTKK